MKRNNENNYSIKGPDNNIICKTEYNDNGNRIVYYKNSTFEKWYEYDENNNLIHYKESNGYEEWYKYDENNKCINIKFSNINEE